MSPRFGAYNKQFGTLVISELDISYLLSKKNGVYTYTERALAKRCQLQKYFYIEWTGGQGKRTGKDFQYSVLEALWGERMVKQ